MHPFLGLLRSLDGRLQLADEEGFGIIEVLVSALLVVLITLGVLAAVDAAGRTSDNNKARGAASNLATADQERLRSIPLSQLTDLDVTGPQTEVDKKLYRVRSQGAYVVGSGQSEQCASTEAAPKYLKITSTARWGPNDNQAVMQESLRAMPNGTIAGRGSLAVDIDGRNGLGLPDPVSVRITGPGTVRNGVTNDKGCVIFGFIPAGTYSITFGKTGYIESKPTDGVYRQNVADSAVVAVDATASASYQYDQASSMAVTYQTTTTPGGTATTNTLTGVRSGFTIANSKLGTPNFRTFATSPGTSIFPFTPYEVWAGTCLGARPTTTANVVTANMTPGVQTGVTVREPKIRIQAQRNTNANGSSSGAIPNNTPVVLRATGTGCSKVYTGTVQSGVANFDVPYGEYEVCLQWAAGSANRQTKIYNITSQVANGQTFNITSSSTTRVPFGTTTNVAGCPTT